MKIFQTNNRGPVERVKANLNECSVENCFVFGDATDKTVTGTTEHVAIDLNKGSYNLALGTQGGQAASDVTPVEYVKYSRSANITISNEDKVLLGTKLISK